MELSVISSWRKEGVEKWAVSSGLLGSLAFLQKECVGGRALLKLNKEDLHRYGLPLGHVIELLEAIEEMRSTGAGELRR